MTRIFVAIRGKWRTPNQKFSVWQTATLGSESVAAATFLETCEIVEK
jgi:hypothetical protein